MLVTKLISCIFALTLISCGIKQDLNKEVRKVVQKCEQRIDEKIAEIEEKFREKNEELEQNKKEEIERIVRETDGDPSELARRLGELTGLSVASDDVE